MQVFYMFVFSTEALLADHFLIITIKNLECYHLSCDEQSFEFNII